jgi:hypothetical protein
MYIGNSSSDGMPNSLIEAMGMGFFNPIQSRKCNGRGDFMVLMDF